MVNPILGAAAAGALLSAQPVQATPVHVAPGGSVTFGEAGLNHAQSTDGRGYIALFTEVALFAEVPASVPEPEGRPAVAAGPAAPGLLARQRAGTTGSAR